MDLFVEKSRKALLDEVRRELKQEKSKFHLKEVLSEDEQINLLQNKIDGYFKEVTDSKSENSIDLQEVLQSTTELLKKYKELDRSVQNISVIIPDLEESIKLVEGKANEHENRVNSELVSHINGLNIKLEHVRKTQKLLESLDTKINLLTSKYEKLEEQNTKLSRDIETIKILTENKF